MLMCMLGDLVTSLHVQHWSFQSYRGSATAKSHWPQLAVQLGCLVIPCLATYFTNNNRVRSDVACSLQL